MKFLLILSFLISSTLFAQTREELIEEYRREHLKMMQEIVKMFNEDAVVGDDFFGDIDPFTNIERLRAARGENVTIEEKQLENGFIEITIIPKDKNTALDISTDNGMLTVKSEQRVEEEQEGSKSMSMSSFTRTISIPSGYSASAPEAVDKGVKITLKPNTELKEQRKKRDKFPVKKNPDEITI